MYNNIQVIQREGETEGTYFKSKTRAVWRIVNRENGKWVSYNKKIEIN
jgi:hypothetical protein